MAQKRNEEVVNSLNVFVHACRTTWCLLTTNDAFECLIAGKASSPHVTLTAHTLIAPFLHVEC